MSKLEERLKAWVREGFIDDGQARRIAVYEDTQASNPWIMTSLFILGAVIVGIGIVSLIAANWAHIPDWVKLGVDFVALGALAFAIYKFCGPNETRPVYAEGLLTSFILLCLASIGLISQIYHSGGHLYQALGVWAAITVGVMLISRHFFVPFIWIFGFLFSLVAISIEAEWSKQFFAENYQAIAMVAPFLCVTLAALLEKVGAEKGARSAFGAWAVLSALAGMFMIEMDGNRYRESVLLKSLSPGYLFAALAAVGIALSPEYRKTQKMLLAAAAVSFIIYFHVSIAGFSNFVSNAVFTIVTLAFFALFLASTHRQRLFQQFVALIGIRFLILYFQALGGLAYTGIGLIVSGIVVIGAAFAWNKYRVKLTHWAEGWAK
ncbi:MAG: DUF2157 domain-containing protein [Bdellovibrionota bacterium]